MSDAVRMARRTKRTFEEQFARTAAVWRDQQALYFQQRYFAPINDCFDRFIRTAENLMEAIDDAEAAIDD